ncbi:protein FAM32A [Toxorhynchites rutilus septentrionalis]|uniref:protein FAM32A n=1 Tax=Toxorhynchites rutilus septentrionalis TaxID=329112 RepID=UPI00247A800B|nr:protein FAM32A [Toxorhynchites rutilus septentrionalis]
MSDEYQYASKSKLKLKCDSEIKKKKKKSKDKEKLREKVAKSVEQSSGKDNANSQSNQSQPSAPGRVLTKAEESFKKMQEKMQKKRIMDKASMTHKQRVEQFNQHLDSLTEHFDIPKVSWTK